MVTCKEKEGAADDDLKEMIAHQVPTTPKGKCFGACIFETIGIVSSIEYDCFTSFFLNYFCFI